MMHWHIRISSVWLCSVAVAACVAPQPADQPPTPGPIGPGGEPNPAPVRDALPAELQLLREQGLALRGDRVELEGKLDFPPRLKAPASPGVQPAILPSPRPSMQESRRSMSAAALASPRVRAALGERFALLGSGWLDDDKDAPPSADERYQLNFYNYGRNEVVTVITSRKSEILDVQSAPARVQPAESREEVDMAVDIVRRDERYGRLVTNLRGRGIVTPGPDADRYLYVLFYREARTPAVVEATVNMSAGKVVAARSLR